MPPDVREWLPADHLAWFVMDAVAEMDLSAFYCSLSVEEPLVKRGALVGVDWWAGGGRLRPRGARCCARRRPALSGCSGLLGPAT